MIGGGDALKEEGGMMGRKRREGSQTFEDKIMIKGRKKGSQSYL